MTTRKEKIKEVLDGISTDSKRWREEATNEIAEALEQKENVEILALRAELNSLKKAKSALQLAILSLDTDGEKSALASLRSVGRNVLKELK